MGNEESYIKQFKDVLSQPDSCQKLYKSDMLNHKTYYNYYAQCLLDMPNGVLNYFERIKSNEVRDASYKVENHSGITKKGDVNSSPFHWEERECIAFWNYFHNSDKTIRILDYQVPLKNTSQDKEDAIDLVGTDGKNLLILEYKRFVTSETLLRSILEIYTYKKLLQEGERKILADYNCVDGKLIPAVVFMENSNQHYSFKEADASSPIRRLFRELGIKAFLIKPAKDFVEDDSLKQKLAMEKPELDFDMDIIELEV